MKRHPQPAWRLFVDAFAFSAGATLGMTAPILLLWVGAWVVDQVELHRREEVSATATA